jgi:CDP-2,3-bis-(O-geranylgeranyl)-sn-glycerol synthase
MAIENLIAFVLPAYFANAAPVIARGKTVVDLGRNFVDGRRVFGDGKTFKGLAAGIVVGTFTGVLLALSSEFFLPGLDFRAKVTIGFLLSIGTMAGDLAGSFLKRRIGIQSGSQHEFFDQLLFLGGALLFAALLYLPQATEIAILVGLTYVLHKLFNVIAHALKLKKVPW